MTHDSRSSQDPTEVKPAFGFLRMVGLLRLLPRELLILPVAVLAAVCVNEVNLWSLRTSDLPEMRALVSEEGFVYSPDQSDYLSPPRSHARGQGWHIAKQNPGKGDYFARTPGYSLVYYPLLRLLGEPNSLRALKVVHLLLYGLSVSCLLWLLEDLTGSARVAVAGSLLYCVLPIGNNFLYQVMTEAVTPAYIVFYVTCLFAMARAKREQIAVAWYLLAGCLWGLLVLTRPVLGIAGLLMPVFGWARFGKRGLATAVRFLMIALLPASLAIGTWTWRNYMICGCFVPLEARHPSLLTVFYGSSFDALRRFTTCWATNADITSYVVPLWNRAIAGEAGAEEIDQLLARWPGWVVEDFGRPRLTGALEDFQRNLVARASYYQLAQPLPDDYLPEELRARDVFLGLESECREGHPWRYWVSNTARYLGYLVLHSNTSSFHFFQSEYRRVRLLNYIRQILGGVHVLMYLFICLVPFAFWRLQWLEFGVRVAVFAVLPGLWILFFTVIFRYIEQRYMLPYLPILYVGTVAALSMFLGSRTSKGRRDAPRLA